MEQTKIIDSPTYGKVVLTHVATMDMTQSGLEESDITEFLNEAHRRHTFPMFIANSHGAWCFSVWLPLQKDNPTLIVATKSKDLERWLAKFSKFIQTENHVKHN